MWGVGGEWVGWRLGTLCVEWGTLCAGLPHAEGMGKGSSVCVCACEAHSSDVPMCCGHLRVSCHVMQKCNQAQLLRVKQQLQECHTHKRRWEEEGTHLRLP